MKLAIKFLIFLSEVFIGERTVGKKMKGRYLNPLELFFMSDGPGCFLCAVGH